MWMSITDNNNLPSKDAVHLENPNTKCREDLWFAGAVWMCLTRPWFNRVKSPRFADTRAGPLSEKYPWACFGGVSWAKPSKQGRLPPWKCLLKVFAPSWKEQISEWHFHIEGNPAWECFRAPPGPACTVPKVAPVSKVLWITPTNLAGWKVIMIPYIPVVTTLKGARSKDWKYWYFLFQCLLSDQKTIDMSKPSCQVTKKETPKSLFKKVSVSKQSTWNLHLKISVSSAWHKPEFSPIQDFERKTSFFSKGYF